MPTTPTSAVLLLSHGSRDPRAQYVVSRLVAAVARRTGLEVRAAHLDFTDPTPDAALRGLADDGFESVRVVPLLFTPGYHLTHDVPTAIEASGVSHRVDVSVAPALVADSPTPRRLLLQALVDRLSEAAGDIRDVDGIVLASAGSSSAQARSHVEALARELGDLLLVPTAVAFASAAVPGPAEALKALDTHGARHPAVAALFVAPGRLPDSVALACPSVTVADPLGVTPAFVDLLVDHALAPTGRPQHA